MHLKSLVLRGFKSFADKAVLHLEPGITAVVGPNGSGKSNISDAVLWVLGERNAKNLRGQAMEDVIFSGSSARKATSMAEVELILDNSDGTLPVDFTEVSIARRMYRSGESEYLINGAVARRMDVLDILHDTGLGTGTHSIISQGALDSVLRSKPEDRRMLIEEAAGVLKHKQRIAKSARKLERMQQNMDRVSDVVNEVGRQLGPLERKAKRALKYEELAEELAQVRLVLAVDDLRTLKTEHARITEREAMASEACAAAKKRNEEIDQELTALQEKIREDSLDTSALSQHYQRMTAAAERLDSTSLLIRDRRRAALSRASELASKMEQTRAQEERAQVRLAELKVQAESERKELTDAQARMDGLSTQDQDLAERLKGAQERSVHAADLLSSLEKESNQTREDLARAKEVCSNSMAHIKVIEGHRAELSLQVDRLSADAKLAQTESESAQAALMDVDAQEKEARTLVGRCMQARDGARRAFEDAAAQEQSLEAQIKGLVEIEEAESARSDGAARKAAAVLKDAGDDALALSRIVAAPPELEGLVEALLGSDLSALIVKGASEIEAVEGALLDEDAGSVTLLMEDGEARTDGAAARAHVNLPAYASFLSDEIAYPEQHAPLLHSLLDDVIICSTLTEALSLHAGAAGSCRIAARDGSIVHPSGKVELRVTGKGPATGVLSRLRRINELKSALEVAKEATRTASEEAKAAEEALVRAQTASLDVKEQLASLRGNAQSARLAAEAAAEKLGSATRELEALDAALERETGSVDAARPDIEQAEARLEGLARTTEEARAEAEAADLERAPLAAEREAVGEELAAARLAHAKLAERATYSERVIASAVAEVRSLQASHEEDAHVQRLKKASAERLAPLLSVIDAIVDAARASMRSLEDASSTAKSATDGLHAQMQKLREQAHEAQDAYDARTDELAEVRVEKTRAEMQVQAAVEVITSDCGVPLERALAIQPPEDRGQVEEESFRLTRRISNLGTINPDAAEEYEQLKGRYDYLEGQLSDMRSAARTLLRINAVIEERMKDDFARTFDEVNRNFQEIFSTLFPGGSAELALVSPEDVEESGVEVNAQPAGKRITKMTLMSGGEKSLTALALLFAVYKTRVTPFYILDEVEAALDDSNLRRLIAYIQRMRQETQLIMITHQRRTMEMADVLFGVSMQADGVTKVISQKLEDALRS